MSDNLVICRYGVPIAPTDYRTYVEFKRDLGTLKRGWMLNILNRTRDGLEVALTADKHTHARFIVMSWRYGGAKPEEDW